MNRTILSSFLVIVAILFSATIFAFSSCSTEQSKYPKLDQYLETLGDNNKFMGSISVFRGDTQIYSNGANGSFAVKENTNAEDSTTNIELLFNAAIENKKLFKQIFNK